MWLLKVALVATDKPILEAQGDFFKECKRAWPSDCRIMRC